MPRQTTNEISEFTFKNNTALEYISKCTRNHAQSISADRIHHCVLKDLVALGEERVKAQKKLPKTTYVDDDEDDCSTTPEQDIGADDFIDTMILASVMLVDLGRLDMRTVLEKGMVPLAALLTDTEYVCKAAEAITHSVLMLSEEEPIGSSRLDWATFQMLGVLFHQLSRSKGIYSCSKRSFADEGRALAKKLDKLRHEPHDVETVALISPYAKGQGEQKPPYWSRKPAAFHTSKLN